MCLRRLSAALTAACAFAGAASAQTLPDTREGAVELHRFQRGPTFRMAEGDLRQVGTPMRDGLIAALPVARNVQVGIGRFAVPQLARPRTYMESDRQPTAVRTRDRGIAAVGVSLRF